MKSIYIVNVVGFVGSIGWYDYSFASDWLGLRIDDLERRLMVSIYGLIESSSSSHFRMRSSRLYY